MKVLDKSVDIELSASQKHTFESKLSADNYIITILVKRISGTGRINITINNKSYLLQVKSFSSQFLKVNFSAAAENIFEIKLTEGSIGKVKVSRITITKDYSNILLSDIAVIVPYAMIGGAEIYLKNLLLMTSKKIDVYSNINIGLPCKPYESIQEMCAKNYKIIIFYNSEKIYNELLMYKSPRCEIIEIYHSDFVWPDSMSRIVDRAIYGVIKTSDNIGKHINFPENSLILPPQIDVTKFKTSKVDSKIHTLGFLGRLSKEKDPLFAISVIQKLKNYKLFIAGDGPLKNLVQSATRSLSQIQYFGWTSPEFFLNKIDCLFISSDIEGTPVVIAEALAAGLPIIAPDVGDIKNMLTGTVHYLYKKDSINYKELKNFLEVTAKWNDTNIKAAKEKFDINNNIKKFDNFLNIEYSADQTEELYNFIEIDGLLL